MTGVAFPVGNRDAGTSGAERAPGTGRGDSFEAFYSANATMVYRFALSLVGNRSDAEDVTQATFLKAFQALGNGHRPREPQAWLNTIARNILRERHRRTRHRPRETTIDDVVLPGRDDPPVRATEIRDGFLGLPSDQRRALLQCELQGQTHLEIGEALGLSEVGVRRLLTRARWNFREQLEAGVTCRQARTAVAGEPLRLEPGASRSRRALLAHLRHCEACRAHAPRRSASLATLALGFLAPSWLRDLIDRLSHFSLDLSSGAGPDAVVAKVAAVTLAGALAGGVAWQVDATGGHQRPLIRQGPPPAAAHGASTPATRDRTLSPPVPVAPTVAPRPVPHSSGRPSRRPGESSTALSGRAAHPLLPRAAVHAHPSAVRSVGSRAAAAPVAVPVAAPGRFTPASVQPAQPAAPERRPAPAAPAAAAPPSPDGSATAGPGSPGVTLAAPDPQSAPPADSPASSSPRLGSVVATGLPAVADAGSTGAGDAPGKPGMHGKSADAKGQAGDEAAAGDQPGSSAARGRSADAPGHSADPTAGAPGWSGGAGRSADAPGHSADPGEGAGAPGWSGGAGRSADAPGHSADPGEGAGAPGWSGGAGGSAEAPGHGGAGGAGSPVSTGGAGKSAEAPGHAADGTAPPGRSGDLKSDGNPAAGKDSGPTAADPGPANGSAGDRGPTSNGAQALGNGAGPGGPSSGAPQPDQATTPDSATGPSQDASLTGAASSPDGSSSGSAGSAGSGPSGDAGAPADPGGSAGPGNSGGGPPGGNQGGGNGGPKNGADPGPPGQSHAKS